MSKGRGNFETRKFNQSIDSFYISKPKMATKWKERVNSTGRKEQSAPRSARQKNDSTNRDILNDSFYEQYKAGGPKVLLGSTRRSQPYSILDQQGFNKTSGQLCQLNFSHHNPQLCVCKDCTCGRHLCKLHAIGPNLSKGTVYQKSYTKKDAIPNIVNISGQYPKNEGPHLEMNSTQRKDFLGKKGDDTERPHPQDLLKTGGPCPQLTSYSSGFPGYRGDNQYVKPTDKHTRGNFPLQGRSTYSTAFGPNSGRAASLQKNPDSFKHGQPWLGNTTYGNFFNPPNPDDYAKKYKIVQKLEIDPNFKHQYQSIYKNDFLGTGPTVCPAKIQLETKIKGLMTSKKANFLQNSDYKALSPQFHALSLSKHLFV